MEGFIGLFIIIVIYFCPTIVATNRKHPNTISISILNTLLGWSIIGWILALIWSTSYFRPDDK